jgi:hypothetical protein
MTYLACIALSGCAFLDNLPSVDVPLDDGTITTTKVTPGSLSIFEVLPEDMSDQLRAAHGRFDDLTSDQIDQLTVSVLKATGCNILTIETQRALQYKVFGFSALESVGLETQPFEDWADEKSSHDALWAENKFATGGALHQRAGFSQNYLFAFTRDDMNGVTGLTDCSIK